MRTVCEQIVSRAASPYLPGLTGASLSRWLYRSQKVASGLRLDDEGVRTLSNAAPPSHVAALDML
jgi:hypothetical protein